MNKLIETLKNVVWYDLFEKLRCGDEGLATARVKYLDTKKVEQGVFDYYVAADPSRNRKYLDWMLFRHIEDPNRAEEMVTLIQNFDELAKKGVMREKDIYVYDGPDDYDQVKDLVNHAMQIVTKTQQKKISKKEGAEVVLNNKRFKVIWIKTFDAMALYGGGTRWCVTSLDYWVNYRETTVYVLFDKVKDAKYAIVIYKSPDSPESPEIYSPGGTYENCGYWEWEDLEKRTGPVPREVFKWRGVVPELQ